MLLSTKNLGLNKQKTFPLHLPSVIDRFDIVIIDQDVTIQF